MVSAVKAVKVADMRTEVEDARLINDLRSGSRGNDARQRLLDLEAKYVLFLFPFLTPLCILLASMVVCI